ncbi:cytochrome P450 [Actinomadura opuntiae]|uniref:cytochrome P450 n=1 Tax=Actinomadura sp. OS1-43 TaxID=604315 RepID=UPI00255AE08D|nr:cytochrome P450 [Actinomadura sp. OS1-43]MDL4815816.1 cytochrome P450 [Actinomadura sp. OS1-43]
MATGTVRPEDVDLSDLEFWARPLSERNAAFAALRSLERPPFFAEPDMSFIGAEPGPGYYALVRHADIVEASRTPQVFCSSRGNIAGTFDPPPEFLEYFGSMINMDDPRHARLRRIVSRAFTHRMIAKIEDDIVRAAVRIIEEFRPSGGGDFVTGVAARLPLTIICDLMGVPEERYRRVFDLSNTVIGAFDPEYVPDFAEVAAAVLGAAEELRGMVRDLAAERAERPADDLTSALVHGNVDGESLTDQELGSFFILLVVAGNETTRNAIAHGLKLLTLNPEQRDRWKSDFDRYAPTAVEEIVRLASPVTFMRRTVTRDHELNGQRFKDGDKVLMYYCSANRDEAVFADPDAFDITRSPNPHLGFGAAGPHFCLGAHLARQEITVMFRELFRRLPDIRSTAPPERLYSSFINGIKHLPCEF